MKRKGHPPGWLLLKRGLMPEEQSHSEQGQVERAKSLRDHIDRLKQGEPESVKPQKGKSIKEQIADRADELEK